MRIILVRPQLGNNIGAIARVMQNFSCNELCLVAPRPNWLDDKSISIAAGAENLLKNALVYDDLLSATADLNCIFALTARSRYINKPSLDVKDLDLTLNKYSSQKIGLMFGPENSGLTNEDLVLAHKVIYISTNPEFSSLNIAQAVGITLHEAYQASTTPKNNKKSSPDASIEEVDGFLNHLEYTLSATDFLRLPDKKADMLRNIKNIFTRIENLSSQEVRTLRGIIAALASK